MARGKIMCVLMAIVFTVSLAFTGCGKKDDTPALSVMPANDEEIVINDGEELRYNVDGVRYSGGPPVCEFDLSNGEVNVLLDRLSELDLSEYELYDPEVDEHYLTGYGFAFVISAEDQEHTVTTGPILYVDGVGYKWAGGVKEAEIMKLTGLIKSRHPDGVETDEPIDQDHDDADEPQETTSSEPEPLDDEELRYDVVSVNFFWLTWKSWRVYDYYLTNSEINEFIDALSALDFSDETRSYNPIVGGERPCVIETESGEVYYLVIYGSQIIVAPDEFTLEGRPFQRYYDFDEDSDVFSFVRNLAERVVKAELDEKYGIDRS